MLGDGRDVADPDKIDPTFVRPIYGDDNLYSHLLLIQPTDPADWISPDSELFTADRVLDLIDQIMGARQHYKGSGNPTLFTSTEMMTKMMAVRDTNGRRIHETEASLYAALRVKEIVEVPAMTSMLREWDDSGDLKSVQTVGILVNMGDYVTGANRGGELTWFDQFDIDYNQMKYLLETRLCGALVDPKSAVVIELVVEDLADA